jgi:hypothetical protein
MLIVPALERASEPLRLVRPIAAPAALRVAVSSASTLLDEHRFKRGVVHLHYRISV